MTIKLEKALRKVKPVSPKEKTRLDNNEFKKIQALQIQLKQQKNTNVSMSDLLEKLNSFNGCCTTLSNFYGL